MVLTISPSEECEWERCVRLIAQTPTFDPLPLELCARIIEKINPKSIDPKVLIKDIITTLRNSANSCCYVKTKPRYSSVPVDRQGRSESSYIEKGWHFSGCGVNSCWTIIKYLGHTHREPLPLFQASQQSTCACNDYDGQGRENLDIPVPTQKLLYHACPAYIPICICTSYILYLFIPSSKWLSWTGMWLSWWRDAMENSNWWVRNSAIMRYWLWSWPGDWFQYGSPAEKDNLEVADEILDVNERKLEDLSRTEVIRHIHEVGKIFAIPFWWTGI